MLVTASMKGFISSFEWIGFLQDLQMTICSSIWSHRPMTGCVPRRSRVFAVGWEKGIMCEVIKFYWTPWEMDGICLCNRLASVTAWEILFGRHWDIDIESIGSCSSEWNLTQEKDTDGEFCPYNAGAGGYVQWVYSLGTDLQQKLWCCWCQEAGMLFVCLPVGGLWIQGSTVRIC